MINMRLQNLVMCREAVNHLDIDTKELKEMKMLATKLIKDIDDIIELQNRKFAPYYPTCDGNCDFERPKTRSLQTLEGMYYSCYNCLANSFGPQEASRQWKNMKIIPARCGWCDETKSKCECGK